MNARNQFIFWTVAAFAFFGFIVIFKSVLLPFVLGIVIAYLLNPLVGKLRKIGLRRGPAALFILLCFLAVVMSFLAVLIPVLYKELVEFSADFPGYVDRISEILTPYAAKARGLIGHETGDIQTLIRQHIGTGMNVAGRVLVGLAVGGSAVVDVLAVAVIMPIAAYFMMKEWPRITKWVEDLVPRDKKTEIMDLFRQMDRKLSGFVRGQVSVALILGVFYAIALSIAGLKYGLLIGFSAGLLSIIPMVGSTVGLIVSILVAAVQTGSWVYVAIIAAIFLFGQLVEGNFLTPKLVGESVGMHPLWVFFALMAGGSLFGILGMLIAVPVAAVAGVLIAFGIRKYKASPYYAGGDKKPTNQNKRAS